MVGTNVSPLKFLGPEIRPRNVVRAICRDPILAEIIFRDNLIRFRHLTFAARFQTALQPYVAFSENSTLTLIASLSVKCARRINCLDSQHSEIAYAFSSDFER